MKKFVPPMRKPAPAADAAPAGKAAADAAPAGGAGVKEEEAAEGSQELAAAAPPRSTFASKPATTATSFRPPAPTAAKAAAKPAGGAKGKPGGKPAVPTDSGGAAARCYAVTYCNRKELGKKRKNRSFLDGVLRIVGDNCLLYDEAGAQTGKATVKGLDDLPEGATVVVSNFFRCQFEGSTLFKPFDAVST